MNISSISYHIDDLTALINNYQIRLKVIGLSETRVRKNRPSLSNINLKTMFTSPHLQSLLKVETCCTLTNC